jgi:hypothetical protein
MAIKDKQLVRLLGFSFGVTIKHLFEPCKPDVVVRLA